MDYLLDTGILIRFYQKREQAIAQRLAQAGSVFLSTVTLGELSHGAFRSQ